MYSTKAGAQHQLRITAQKTTSAAGTTIKMRLMYHGRPSAWLSTARSGPDVCEWHTISRTPFFVRTISYNCTPGRLVVNEMPSSPVARERDGVIFDRRRSFAIRPMLSFVPFDPSRGKGTFQQYRCARPASTSQNFHFDDQASVDEVYNTIAHSGLDRDPEHLPIKSLPKEKRSNWNYSTNSFRYPCLVTTYSLSSSLP